MTVKVKICGVTRLEDALAAAELGADALGFNFWSQSKRHISPRAAREIIDALPPLVTTVGVFVNPTASEVQHAIDVAAIRIVQLHGDETPRFCARVERPVIKALRIESRSSLKAARAFDVSGFLFDTPSSGFGGSGRAFDWTLLRGAPKDRPSFVAGGLTAANVAAAIRACHPYGVDVASGVESAPGVKDQRKMKRFIETAKRTK